MPYQQVFELVEDESIHGSRLVDQSVNLGAKGIPGSLTGELFPSDLTLYLKKLHLTGGPSASNEVIDFPHNYGLYADNTGYGSDNSRIWLNGPDQGEFIIGPRTTANKFSRIRLRADEFYFEWEDSGGDSATIVYPSGMIYDWGTDTDTSIGSLAAWPVNMTGLVATASVPANVSVSIMVWVWARVDMSLDQEWIALDATIGGTLPANPALHEQDLTTSAGGTGSTGSGGSHAHAPGSNTLFYNISSAAHLSNTTTDTEASHTHSGPSHTHALSNSWRTLNYYALRSFTPTGSAVTIQARGGSAGGSSQTYDDGVLMYMVIIN